MNITHTADVCILLYFVLGMTVTDLNFAHVVGQSTRLQLIIFDGWPDGWSDMLPVRSGHENLDQFQLFLAFYSWRLLSTELFTTLHLSICRTCWDALTDIPSRSCLRSSTLSHLVVRLSRLVTVRERSFASAGPRLWNSLPDNITTAQSLAAFWRKLKTYLFRQSYPDIIL